MTATRLFFNDLYLRVRLRIFIENAMMATMSLVIEIINPIVEIQRLNEFQLGIVTDHFSSR